MPPGSVLPAMHAHPLAAVQGPLHAATASPRAPNRPAGHATAAAVPPGQYEPAGHATPAAVDDAAGHEYPGAQAQDPSHVGSVYVTALLPRPKHPALHAPAGAAADVEPTGHQNPAASHGTGAAAPPAHQKVIGHAAPMQELDPAGQYPPGAAAQGMGARAPPRQHVPASHLVPPEVEEAAGQ